MNFKSEDTKTWIENDEGLQIALLEHPEEKNGVVNLVHTEVDPGMNGQGLAGKLTEFAALKFREKGIKAVLTCSYSIKWFSKHPEFSDVLLNAEEAKRKAESLAGNACGIQKK